MGYCFGVLDHAHGSMILFEMPFDEKILLILNNSWSLILERGWMDLSLKFEP